MYIYVYMNNFGFGFTRSCEKPFNPLTPMSDQDRISLYKINAISTK